MKRNFALGIFLATVGRAFAADVAEVVIDFEQSTIGKPVPTWTEKGVTFTLAEAPKTSKAAGRVMFFPHLATNHKGLLNAMANEQAIPVQAKFPAPVSAVTIVFWASTGCAAKLQAFDHNDQVIDTASVAVAPSRKAPADPVPFFELTVKSPAIAYVRFSGPRNGEFLAADEVRFTPITTR
ncbi:MAG: hypothetical protein HZA93_15970 [Verrucomicrobia bacterium]|nr:hypothetical protein [Verrucomicrobiota bacterium]